MRVLVCGGRYFTDGVAVSEYLTRHYGALLPGLVIIHGNAKGADRLADRWAKNHGLKPLTFPAAWYDLTQPGAVIKTRADGTKYDVLAGFRRNQQMLDEGKPDVVVAFRGGDGTDDMVKRAQAAGVPVVRVK